MTIRAADAKLDPEDMGTVPLLLSRSGHTLRTVAECVQYRQDIAKARHQVTSNRKRCTGSDLDLNESIMLPRKHPQVYHMEWVGDQNIVNDFDWREGSSEEDSHQAHAKPASGPSSHIARHDIHQLSRPRAPVHPSNTNPPLPKPRQNKAGNVNPPDSGHSQLPPQVLVDDEVDEGIEMGPLAFWEKE